jgi:hypothetical protein
LAIFQRKLPPNHQDTADVESKLGGCLIALGRPAEAEPLLVSGYEKLQNKLGSTDPRTLAAQQRLTSFHPPGR